MPRYRINYIARSTKDPLNQSFAIESRSALPVPHRDRAFSETEYEDQIEATSPPEALNLFFEQHVEYREDVMIKGTDGRAHPIEGLADYDPGTVYLWIEDHHMMMEYQGIEEMTPGLVVCPMCNGSGEVDEHLVDSYDEIAQREGAEA